MKPFQGPYESILSTTLFTLVVRLYLVTEEGKIDFLLWGNLTLGIPQVQERMHGVQIKEMKSR